MSLSQITIFVKISDLRSRHDVVLRPTLVTKLLPTYATNIMMKNSALIAFVRIYNPGHLPLQYRVKVIFTKLFFKKFTSTPWGKHMSGSAWFYREKARKKEWDKRWDSEHCYKKLLRGNISTAINSAKKKFEEETLYIEITKSTNAATNQQRRIWFCRLYQCFLRFLRFI